MQPNNDRNIYFIPSVNMRSNQARFYCINLTSRSIGHSALYRAYLQKNFI